LRGDVILDPARTRSFMTIPLASLFVGYYPRLIVVGERSTTHAS
jgi:hypothetical protein